MLMKEGHLPPLSANRFCECPTSHMVVAKSQEPPGCGAGCLSTCHMDKAHHVSSQIAENGLWVCSMAPHFLSMV